MYYNNYIAFIYRTVHNIKTQHNNSNNKEEGRNTVCIFLGLFANKILFCCMYANNFLFSLLFIYYSFVEFEVISSLNITTQPSATTNKTVGSTKKPYDCYHLPCYIVSTMFFIFCYLYFGSPIVSIIYYCYLLWLCKYSFIFVSFRWDQSE